MSDRYDLYPIELIKTGMSLLAFTKDKSGSEEDPRRYLMLYCLQNMGNGQYLPLNRNYKPIGLGIGFADYEKYTHLFIPKDRINLSVLWDNGPNNFSGDGNYFTFSDSTYPNNKINLRRYFEIIEMAFLDIKHKKTFPDFWMYKSKLCSDEYMRNLNRFIL